MRIKKILFYILIGFVFVFPVHQVFAAPIELKLLVALINFTDFNTKPYTKASIEASTFGATNSIKSYYETISEGKITFVGDVLDWTTVTRPNTDCTKLTTWENAIKPVLEANGVDFTQYKYVMFMYPAVACASSGTAWYGQTGKYPSLSPQNLFSHIYGYNNAFVPVHELGHSLGIAHADSFACNNAQIDSAANCTQTAYQDLSDVMGVMFSIGKPLMFNAPHLMYAKFLPPEASQVVSTTTGGGVFTINSLESQTGLRVLKIKKIEASTQMSYFISMRQATGVDALMPTTYLGGANIHFGYDDIYGWGTVETKIVSVTGKHNPKYALSDGMTFSDPAGGGLVIRQLSHTASTVTLEITFGKPSELPGCTPVAPTVTVTPAALSGAPGSILTYTVTVKNNDPIECPTAQFAFGRTVPAGWSTTNSVPSISVMPGKTSSATINVNSAVSATANDYPITFSVSDTLTPLHAASGSTVFTVNPDACVRAAPLITSSPWFVKTTGPGVLAQYVVRVTQKDTGCPVSTYQFATSSLPTGWTSTLSLKSANLTLQNTYSDIVVRFTSLLGSDSGTTSLPFVVTDAATPSHATSTELKYIIPPSPTTCTRNNPLFSLSPLTKSGAAGDQLLYTVSLTNRDTTPCAPTTFNFLNTLNFGLPTNWIVVLEQTSMALSPGGLGTLWMSIMSAPEATMQSYPFTLPVQDTNHSTSAGGTYVVNYTPPIDEGPTLPTGSNMSLSAKRVRIGGGVTTLSWWVDSLVDGVSCSVTPSALIASGDTTSTGGTSWGSEATPIVATTVTLTTPTIFRLTCTNGVSSIVKEASVLFVPSVTDL